MPQLSLSDTHTDSLWQELFSVSHWTPEQSLWGTCLLDAYTRALHYRWAPSRLHRDYRDEYAWFFHTDYRPGSFLWILDMINQSDRREWILDSLTSKSISASRYNIVGTTHGRSSWVFPRVKPRGDYSFKLRTCK